MITVSDAKLITGKIVLFHEAIGFKREIKKLWEETFGDGYFKTWSMVERSSSFPEDANDSSTTPDKPKPAPCTHLTYIALVQKTDDIKLYENMLGNLLHHISSRNVNTRFDFDPLIDGLFPGWDGCRILQTHPDVMRSSSSGDLQVDNSLKGKLIEGIKGTVKSVNEVLEPIAEAKRTVTSVFGSSYEEQNESPALKFVIAQFKDKEELLKSQIQKLDKQLDKQEERLEKQEERLEKKSEELANKNEELIEWVRKFTAADTELRIIRDNYMK
jgi:chaperonin cofactor prefoldin